MPLLVRNNEKGPVVFTDLANNVAIEWKDKDHPSGEDVQPVSESMLDHPNFIKALNQGVLVIEEAPPGVKERVDQQIAAAQRRRKDSPEGEQDVPVVSRRGGTVIGTVTTETDKFDNERGKAIEKEIPVVMTPREYDA